MKVQKRRSVSLKPDVYDRIRAYCAERGIAMSHFAEALIDDGLARARAAEERAAEERAAEERARESARRQLSLPVDKPGSN